MVYKKTCVQSYRIFTIFSWFAILSLAYKEGHMIGMAKQSGSNVEVFSETGNYLFRVSGELMGFTGATVAVKNGSSIYVYDQKGNYLFCR